jgi:hypothetical protein
MRKRFTNAGLAVVILVVPLSAQMGRGPAGSISRSVTSFSARTHPHNPFAGAVYLGSPFWLDGAPYSQSPSVVVVQAPPATTVASSKPIEETKLPTALMIEWQGDRYVRRTDPSGSARSSQPDYIAETRPSSTDKRTAKAQSQSASSQPPQLLPATFVFRDGHREQSSDYSIIAGVIYSRGDFWIDGYWSKQIPVSELDVPATLKANEERGVTFRLPSAPNEVVTRP